MTSASKVTGTRDQIFEMTFASKVTETRDQIFKMATAAKVNRHTLSNIQDGDRRKSKSTHIIKYSRWRPPQK
jgi:hypothetical protein